MLVAPPRIGGVDVAAFFTRGEGNADVEADTCSSSIDIWSAEKPPFPVRPALFSCAPLLPVPPPHDPPPAGRGVGLASIVSGPSARETSWIKGPPFPSASPPAAARRWPWSHRAPAPSPAG